MAEFHFTTTWVLSAPIAPVWEALTAPARWPEWWPGLERAVVTAPGAADGLHQVTRFEFRSATAYRVCFDTRVTRIEAPHVIDGVASGDVEGTGRWRLYAGEGTVVVYEWRVRTRRAWMTLAAPLARPLFRRNHDRLMADAGRGLARRLGARLL